MLETVADLRSMFDPEEIASVFDIGGGACINGVLDNNFDQSLDINGRRTGVRCVSLDVSGLAVATTIKDLSGGNSYIVREKESGARTTLLILERV